MRLYEIANEYEKALVALSEMDGVTKEMIDDTLSHLKEPLEQKILNIAAYIKNIESDIKAMRDYERAMSERRHRLENHRDNIKRYLLETMQRTEISKVRGNELDVSVRRCAYSVNVLDELAIPDEFKRIKQEVDKQALKEALRNGLTLDGARLEQSITLVIG